MTSFWLSFAIQEVLTLAGLAVNASNISAEKKAALETLIQAGVAFLQAK